MSSLQCAKALFLNPKNYWVIPKRADYYTPRLARSLGIMMSDVVEPIIARGSRDGFSLKQARQVQEVFEAKLAEQMSAWSVGLGREGYKIAERILKPHLDKSWDEVFEAKASIPVARGFGEYAQVENHLRVKMGKWVKSTSKAAARTVSSQIEAIIKSAMVFQDDNQRGLTPSQIAKYFTEQFESFSDNYATLIARTTTNYTYNDGAVMLYQDVGFSKGEWIITDDDATCEYCEQFDGYVFTLGEPVVEKGSSVSGSGVSDLEVSIDIPHAPLHPHCRCTVGVSDSDPLLN